MEPSPYRGIHTSLYHTLPADAVQHLERAIWLKMLGRTSEARAIYHDELGRFRTYPVVITELADLEHESGRWGEAWRILEAGLNDFEGTKPDLYSPEYRLMALTRAMLGTRHRGDVESSAHEVARTQRWLQNVPVGDYTDIQVSYRFSLTIPLIVPLLIPSPGKLRPPIRGMLPIHKALLGLRK